MARRYNRGTEELTIMSVQCYAPGSFCWAELQTSDPAAAKSFYGEMFGWTTADFPMQQGVYTMFRKGADDVGAACAVTGGAPSHWGVYFATTDLQDSADHVVKLGGTILAGPFDVMESGRMCAAQDPQGAHFSLWQANKHVGATYEGEMGRIVWPELCSPDPAGSVAFYSALFAWGAKPDSGFDQAQYIEWQQGGNSMGGLLPMRGDAWKGMPPAWGVYVTVADCDERVAMAQSLGAQVYMPPTDIPTTGRFATLADPQGAVVNIVRLAARQLPASA
jgi:predicted enzyme related to lactoylglutathione lyase